jgi:hypothetical protein
MHDNTFLCPICGQRLQVEVDGADYVLPPAVIPSPRADRRFQFEAATTPPWAPSQPRAQEMELPRPVAFTEAERRMPYRTPGLEPDVLVPGAKALFTGVACGIVVGIASAVFGWPWYTFVGGFGGGAAGGWFVFVADSNKLLWRVERIIGRDLNDDGDVGEPKGSGRKAPQEPASRILRVEVAQENQTRFLDVPQDKAVKFARSVLAGRSMSEQEWKTYFGGIKEFKEFRGKLLDGGLVRWVNPKAHSQGLELTRAGRAVFRRLANLSPTEPG